MWDHSTAITPARSSLASAQVPQPARETAAAIRCHALNDLVERSVAALPLPDSLQRDALEALSFSKADLHEITVLEARSPLGSTVAFAAWEPLLGTVEIGDPRIMLLRAVCVDPDWQGGGIGSGLLEAVVKAADERGMNLIVTYAWPGADAFLARRGFVPVASDIDRNGLKALALRLANNA